MSSVCRSSNLQALLDGDDLPKEADPLLAAYRFVESEDHRGTRLADEHHYPPTKPPRQELLDDEVYQLLLQTLDKKFGTSGYTTKNSGVFSVARQVEQLEKVSIRGVVYACEKSLPRDSNVIFRRLGGSSSRVGSVESIFRHVHQTPEGLIHGATFVLVHEYLPILDETMQSKYTQFGFAGGFLSYGDRWSKFHVIELGNVVCHFAKTAVSYGDAKVMHVLPLNKVSRSVACLSQCLTEVKDDGLLHTSIGYCVELLSYSLSVTLVLFMTLARLHCSMKIVTRDAH